MTEYRGALSRVARVTCARALKTARRGMSDARHRGAMGRGTLTPRPMARADPFAPRARYVAVDASFAYALFNWTPRGTTVIVREHATDAVNPPGGGRARAGGRAP